MTGVEVEPDVVLRAASLVLEAADRAHAPVAHTAARGLGTDGLDAAATRLATMVSTGATVLGDVLEQTAHGLRDAAGLYRTADEEAGAALGTARRDDGV